MEEVSLLSAVFVSKIEHTNIIIQNNDDGVVSISVEQILRTTNLRHDNENGNRTELLYTIGCPAAKLKSD